MADEIARPGSVAGTSVNSLAARFGLLLEGPDTEVHGVSHVSSQVIAGDLFAALPGATTHGISFASAAVSAGAVAVLTDRSGALAWPVADRAGASVLVDEGPTVRIGPIASAVYGEPSTLLAVYGVTGTSGKTTTAGLLQAGLTAVTGAPAGMIGTLGAFIGSQRLAGGLTTPAAADVQTLLAVLVDRGAAAVVMEVSSHALSLGRVDGVQFAVAGFTNLSQDHLDFHPDMDDYFNAKRRLFDGRAAVAVVCVDDEAGGRLAAELRDRPAAVVTVAAGDSDADWTASQVATAPDGSTSFLASGPLGSVRAGCAVAGRHNVANVLLALAMIAAEGADLDAVQSAATAMVEVSVPGRMERVDSSGLPVLALVDYSHKPAAVEAALRAAQSLVGTSADGRPGRVLVVLGCGGDRDQAKRPLMGAAAVRGSDLFVLTDDNPRSEDPAAVRAQVRAGAEAVPSEERRAELVEIGERGAAIAAAVAAARAGDVVLVAGKGHETGQDIGGVVRAFDDRSVLAAALRDRARASRP